MSLTVLPAPRACYPASSLARLPLPEAARPGDWRSATELPSYVRPSAGAVYVRRRLAVLVALVALLVVLVAVVHDLRASASHVSVPAGAPSVYTVRPGDTLWSVARSIQPEGDVRPLVDALAAANGGSALEVGQQLVVP